MPRLYTHAIISRQLSPAGRQESLGQSNVWCTQSQRHIWGRAGGPVF